VDAQGVLKGDRVNYIATTLRGVAAGLAWLALRLNAGSRRLNKAARHVDWVVEYDREVELGRVTARILNEGGAR
jgi:hypothetical protein